MTDTASLTAGRETDMLVAKALGWTDLVPPGQQDWQNPIGKPPGAERQALVPCYSTTTAALLALESWQKRTEADVVIRPRFHAENDNEQERWFVYREADSQTDDGPYFYAPTPWLAICKLIVATAPKEQEAASGS